MLRLDYEPTACEGAAARDVVTNWGKGRGLLGVLALCWPLSESTWHRQCLVDELFGRDNLLYLVWRLPQRWGAKSYRLKLHRVKECNAELDSSLHEQRTVETPRC